MKYPLIGICGPAGSGKDTVAAIVARKLGGQTIALADPMKRFAQTIFGFSEEQLWGPSEMRNKPDPRWTPEKITAIHKKRGHILFTKYSDSIWNILGAVDRETYDNAVSAYEAWIQDAIKVCHERGVVTPRYILQTMGTEWGRAVDMNIWVKKALRDIETLLSDPEASYERTLGVVARPPDGPPRPPEVMLITDVRFRNEALAIKALGGEVWRIQAPNVSPAAAGAAGIVGHSSETELEGIPSSWFSAVIHNNKDAGIDALRYEVCLFLDHRMKESRAAHCYIHHPDEL
jgi:hypothetical protein